jgi:hypothetical protein
MITSTLYSARKAAANGARMAERVSSAQIRKWHPVNSWFFHNWFFYDRFFHNRLFNDRFLDNRFLNNGLFDQAFLLARMRSEDHACNHDDCDR